MNPLLHLITILNLGFFVTTICFVLKKWRRSKAHRRFAFVLIFGFLWVLDSYLQGFKTTYFIFLTYANFAIAACAAGAMASFALHYPNENIKLTLRKEILFQLPIIFTAILSFTGLFVQPVSFKIIEQTPYYYIYFFVIIVYFLILSIGKLLRTYVSSTGIQRQQVKMFLLGYAIAIFFQLGESFYINTVQGIPVNVDRIIFNITIFFTGLASYAIIRYRFLDLRVTIQRGAIRALTFLIVFGLYLLGILLIHESIRPQTRDGDVMFLVIVTLVVVLTVEPIRKFIFKKVDLLFDSNEEKQRRMRERIRLATTTQQTHEALMATALDFVRATSGFQDVSFVESRNDFFHGKIATRSYLERFGRMVVTGELPYRLEENEAFVDILNELKGSGVGLLLPIGKGELFMGCFVIRSQQNSIFPSQTIQALKDLQFQISDAIIGARLYKQAVERIKA
jgi:hypothetical protein